ncbi:MAG: hypothetical protein [Bacteriophage sp.]|mgnify:FL=1|jgi:hypothetical protein|nr:MAG: hypothetical protein [Bacteriophage sp.]UVY43160.1 MAG: hypothetical protein [Bacteriophage sp.]UVY55314.1 MAG: hypothetical protein [Bacteriophage sp.]UVY57661.1 MAG: hypothetical protein [Bacteriophage sp.]UWF90095.1 MAG: hypothetical protein [Bacteriophage sp.]
MKKIIIILGVLVVVLVAYFLNVRVSQLKHDRDTYKRNNAVLLNDVKYYRALDSLNAAKVGVLELSIQDYERFMKEDADLINKLKRKNEELQNFSKIQAETIIKIRAQVKDSLIYIPGDTAYQSIPCVSFRDSWTNIEACVYNDTLIGDIQIRDSLILYETIIYKRFLGVLWKTKKIKERSFNIVSKNPYTEIKGVEVVSIRK